MNKEYHIETSHTPEECLAALDEMMGKGEDILKRFRWACKSGDHRGWAFVMAESIDEVRDMLPPSARSKSMIMEVVEFTPEEIRRAHENM